MTTIGIYSANYGKMNNSCEPKADWQAGLLPVVLKIDPLQKSIDYKLFLTSVFCKSIFIYSLLW